MADAGRYVTDNEVKAVVPNIENIGITEKLIIQGVEDVVDRECNRTSFISTAYSNEEYSIDVGEVSQDGIAVSRRRQFLLRNIPVTAVSSMKWVTARSSVDGSVSASNTIARDAYHVDSRSGIVTLINLIDVTPLIYSSFPAGTANVLMSYTAGYTSANFPPALKLAILQIIARIFQLNARNSWSVDSLSGEFGTTQFKRVALTEEERLFLGKFKRPVFPTYGVGAVI